MGDRSKDDVSVCCLSGMMAFCWFVRSTVFDHKVSLAGLITQS